MPPSPVPVNTTNNMQDQSYLLQDAVEPVGSAFATAPSRWPLVTMSVRIGAGVAGAGVQVTQTALGTTTIVALFTAGAAASATGIGLIVGGAVITLGSITASARSAYKTYKHIKGLDALQARAKSLPCDGIGTDGKKTRQDAAEHEAVIDALDYVISKKEKKLDKKVAGSLGAGIGVTVFTMGKSLYKRLKGTKGVNRTAQANAVARHLVTHNCALAQGIVAELYSVDEMLWMLQQDSGTVATLVAAKMKST